jgi:hypothetical protein
MTIIRKLRIDGDTTIPEKYKENFDVSREGSSVGKFTVWLYQLLNNVNDLQTWKKVGSLDPEEHLP